MDSIFITNILTGLTGFTGYSVYRSPEESGKIQSPAANN
jgi:hypothetical protein